MEEEKEVQLEKIAKNLLEQYDAVDIIASALKIMTKNDKKKAFVKLTHEGPVTLSKRYRKMADKRNNTRHDGNRKFTNKKNEGKYQNKDRKNFDKKDSFKKNDDHRKFDRKKQNNNWKKNKKQD